MTYKLVLNKKSLKFLNKRTEKEKSNIDTKLKILKNNPYPNSLLDIKKLSSTDFYRLRVNNYRIIYEIIDDELVILVVDVNNRGDIY